VYLNCQTKTHNPKQLEVLHGNVHRLGGDVDVHDCQLAGLLGVVVFFADLKNYNYEDLLPGRARL
jgi:hypothetical protein